MPGFGWSEGRVEDVVAVTTISSAGGRTMDEVECVAAGLLLVFFMRL